MTLSVFVTVCILTAFVAAEHCPIQQFKDTLIECIDGRNGQPVFPIGQPVAMGTECVISDGNSSYPVKCNGPEWERVEDLISANNLSLAKLLSRHKRNPFTGVSCWALGAFCQGRPGPPPDRTSPVFTYCPEPHITANPGPFQTYAKVTWKEPTAHDDVDGHISPQLIQGRHSGRHFPGDQTTTVRYMAKDRSGNVNYCNIYIEVIVIRCPPPLKIENGYFSCFPTTEYLLGGHCYFGCYDGYELVGQRLLTCQASRSWTGSQPFCKEIECPALPSVEGAGMPLCTNGNKFKSVCTYQCLNGYDMPPRVSKALACTSQKTWRASGEPKCIDVESPQFLYCPSVQIFGTDPGLNTSKVYWDQPIVVDNSDVIAKVQPELNQESREPGDKLVAGMYTIEYSAKDKQGNSARPCIFNVVVRDVRCPQLYPTPYQQISCPSGSRSQSFCSISCSGSRVLDPPNNDVQCEQQTGQLFGKWKWSSGQQPVCKTTNFCVPLPAPVNGAVACDNWYQGKYCQVQCRNGTRMTGGLPRDLFVCSPTAMWSISPDIIRPCLAERRPRPHVGIDAMFYFDGECTSSTAKQHIAQNFIDKLSTTGFGNEICQQRINECQPQNVQITCGESRERRDTDTDTDHNVIMTIHFELTVPVPLTEDTYADDQRQVYNLYESMKVAIENLTKEMFGNRSSVLEITNTGIGVTCPDGSVKSETGLSCLDCPEGTYFDRRTIECKSCTKGFYQDQTGSSSCVKCPYTTTTRRIGSVSFQDCEDACEPGSYSSDGIVPCTPCTIGTYQPSYGQTGCHACRGSKTTFTDGAIASSECQEFDIMFPKFNETSSSTISFPARTVRDFSVTFWVRVNDPGSPFPSLELYNTKDVRVWTFDSLQKVTHGECSTVVDQPIRDRRWHHVTIKGRECFANVYIDGILLTGTKIPGRCSEIEISRILFTAGSGFEGGLSQLNVWDQAVIPVSFSRCFSFESGNLVKWQDFDDSILTGGYLQIPSQCDDFDNCISNPCENNAICTDNLHGYQCACANGFTGSRCEVNIDDCEANICRQGSTCQDGVQSYTCLCPLEFTGIYCEIQVVNGHWSGWGNWSECTTSCGEGTQSRKRLCTNPNPENGGKDCEGPNDESRDCYNIACPVCPEIVGPPYGSFKCTNTTDYISCTLTCVKGYDFDLEPLPVYFCGWNTSYEWNFQNDKNPTGRTPNCVAIEYPEQLTVHYSAQYRDLFCMNHVMSQDTNESIRKRVSSVVSELPCIKNGKCELKDVVITNCDGALRERRQTETAEFTLTIASNGSTSDLLDLEEAFIQFRTAVETGELTTEVLGDEYELVVNSTSVSGDVTCAAGSTRVNYYCIPCGPGTFQYEDFCQPCDIGTYQDTSGSRDCVPCPKGTSTVGILSRGVADCSVTVDSIGEPIKVTAIVLGCCSAVVLIGVAIFVYRRYRSHREKIVAPMDVILSTQAPIGPSNKRFVVSSQSARSTQSDTRSFDNRGFVVGIDGIVHHEKSCQ